MSTVKVPTLAECVAAMNLPTDKWPGRCHEIACGINRELKLGWQECYGGYLGKVNPGGLFVPGKSINRHGWLKTPDGRVFDPTRWVFEVVEPYIYCEVNDLDYDYGMERIKAAIFPEPPPDDEGEKKRVDFAMSDRLLADWLSEVFPNYPSLTIKQVAWLANKGPRYLGDKAKPVYEKIVEVGHRAFIPIDYQVAILGGGRY